MGAPLTLSLPPWKAQLLSQLRLEGAGADPLVSIRATEPQIDPRLLAGARILMARDASEVEGRSLDKLGDLSKGALAKDNERSALRALSGVCAVALSRFTTALEDDVAVVSNSSSDGAGADDASGILSQEQATSPQPATPLSEDERLAVRFRMEKKRILSRAIHSLGHALAAAQGSAALKERAASGAGRKGSKPSAATAKGFGAGGSKPKA